MSGIVGRAEYLRELLLRYGPFETIEFIICCELGLPDCDDLRKGLEDESDLDETEKT